MLSLYLKQTVALLSQLGWSSLHQAPYHCCFSSRPAPLSCLRPLWKINKRLEVTDALREIEDGEYLGERGWSGVKNGGGGYPGWWDLKALILREIQDYTVHQCTCLWISLWFYFTVQYVSAWSVLFSPELSLEKHVVDPKRSDVSHPKMYFYA